MPLSDVLDRPLIGAFLLAFAANIPLGIVESIWALNIEDKGGSDLLVGVSFTTIAIARVLLKNAPILVLDEATSALDSEVEAAIQEQLHALMQGKTVIAIAHRLSTIAALDRLVVMDEGRIVEEGTHKELLDRGGIYASLWQRQSGGFLGVDIEQERRVGT